MDNSYQTLAQFDASHHQLTCKGDWNLAHLSSLSNILDKITWPKETDLIINGEAVSTMDSAGAWLLTRLEHELAKKNVNVKFEHFSEAHLALIHLIEKRVKTDLIPPVPKRPLFLETVGEKLIFEILEVQTFLTFVGKLAMELLRIIKSPIHVRWNAFLTIIYRNGYQALPIIALLSFMIGIVITYQMGLQLKNYGANIYIVDLLGFSIFREFAPLMTAIMVAGRTGSAFTAQLGIMQINEEIAALDTMGVTPAELLIIPRIVGLFIVLPLLTMWSNIFGIIGGMVMANNQLQIPWFDFLHRFPHVVPLRSFIIGIGKAPVFALIIATIGCFEGMRVRGSADSVGQNTTRSVVLSIFFIIVADAIFSVIFSELKL